MKNDLTLTALLIAILALGVGCDESDKAPDFGQVRVKNEASSFVDLLINGEPQQGIEPGKQRSFRVGEGLQQLELRSNQDTIFKQGVTIPDNTFAVYTVHADKSVSATAGNIERPDVVGSSLRQIRLENTANFPVRMLINGEPVATVSSQKGIAVSAPDVAIAVNFQRTSGALLFEQTLTVPRNTTINYAVLEDGMVITTGGPIVPNQQYVYVDYSYR